MSTACPHCGQQISETAVVCRHCRSQVAPELRPVATADDQRDQAPGGADPILLIVLGLVLGIIGAAITASQPYDDDGLVYAGLLVVGIGSIVALVGTVALGVSIGIRHAARDRA